jgi:hypothetical protein
VLRRKPASANIDHREAITKKEGRKMLTKISNPHKTHLLTAIVVLAVLFIFPAGSAYAAWPEVEKLLAADGNDNDWFGYSVSVSGNYAIVGAYEDDVNGTDSGSAYIFFFDGTSWSEQAKLTAADGAADDEFGFSVSISGDYAIVGAYKNDANGSAYIFKRDGTSWSEQAKLLAADGAADDYFGHSVSISGDYAIVGANWDDDDLDDCGSAYIFKRDGTSWSEQRKLLAYDFALSDHFGGSVSISGDCAIVGAHANDDSGVGSGSAYIFKRDGTNWSLQGKLTASDAAAYDYFGVSVSINGDYAIVGAYGDDDNGGYSGSAYIFTPNDVDPNNWDQVAKLTASDGAAVDNFGYSVSVSGDYAIVGAWQDDDNGTDCGSAYIFKRDGTSWSEQAKLLASDGNDFDRFGCSVSISGDYAIVGAYQDDDNGTDSGSAYIFTPNDVNCGDWDQVAKLSADDGAAEDYFGISVSVSGGYAIVGASYDDDSGTDSGSAYIFTPNDVDPNNWDQIAKLTASDGADGDWFGNSVSISGDYAIVGAYGDDGYTGSAYIFFYNGTNWSQQDKLLASDGAVGDWFGNSVSISGDYAVVGAYGDDGYTGSAYIFERSGTSWSEQAKLTASDGAASDRFGTSVSVSGDYAIIGADSDNSAYIFERSGTNWSEQAKLLPSDGAADDFFGCSVSVSGDYAVVGAWGDDDNGTDSGSAYIFKRDGTNWTEQAKLGASDGAADDWFGWSVSISGDYAVAGAFYDDDSGSDSGSAYMFGKGLCPSSDLTGDCLVNFEDFAIMAGEWLQGVL